MATNVKKDVEQPYSDAAQKGKTTFINCVVREGIEVHLAMAPMATRKIG
jgi:hypothetical protein